MAVNDLRYNNAAISLNVATCNDGNGALQRYLAALPRLPPFAQWAHFLRNHDELGLGRSTLVHAAFAPARKVQPYGRGIRRRPHAFLGMIARRIELAFRLLFSPPGTSVIYYGDELGMGTISRFRSDAGANVHAMDR